MTSMMNGKQRDFPHRYQVRVVLKDRCAPVFQPDTHVVFDLQVALQHLLVWHRPAVNGLNGPADLQCDELRRAVLGSAERRIDSDAASGVKRILPRRMGFRPTANRFPAPCHPRQSRNTVRGPVLEGTSTSTSGAGSKIPSETSPSAWSSAPEPCRHSRRRIPGKPPPGPATSGTTGGVVREIGSRDMNWSWKRCAGRTESSKYAVRKSQASCGNSMSFQTAMNPEKYHAKQEKERIESEQPIPPQRRVVVKHAEQESTEGHASRWSGACCAGKIARRGSRIRNRGRRQAHRLQRAPDVKAGGTER